MSEKIKISIVIDDEKPNAESLLLTQNSSMTLMSVLLQNRLLNGSFCGGRGDCGRCVVQFLEGAPLPTGLERARLTPEELRQGYRLACLTRPKTDCTVRIVDSGDVETAIVTEVNLPSENIDLNGRQRKLSENQKSGAAKLDVGQADDSENDVLKSGRYIIAVDLGTTTIAMQLRDMETGATADTYCEKNPQRIYGTDVLARIEASCSGNREELKKLVCESLLRGLRQFTAYLRKRQSEESGRGGDSLYVGKEAAQIVCMCIAGNTTMEHLLMGYDVESLGRAPFVPVETGVQQIQASRLFLGVQNPNGDENGFILGKTMDFPVYIAPCVSAFVGGDIVTGLYVLGMLPKTLRKEDGEDGTGTASRMAEREKKLKEDAQVTLLIDLGTNGEMAIADGTRMIVTATAAGPAFEGRGDLIGTDRIAFTADLLRRGVLDETGLLAEPWFEEGVPVDPGRGNRTAAGQGGENRGSLQSIKNECYFYKEDIRALQMAKAAVRAGVEILWEEMGRPQINRIYLAGGFGYYLDVEAAFAIGLLPMQMRGGVRAVGNTSLAGAYELGRDLLKNRTEGEVLEKKLAAIESINLAEKENFEKLYLKYMNFEEN